jgi:hypothetical protein
MFACLMDEGAIGLCQFCVNGKAMACSSCFLTTR